MIADEEDARALIHAIGGAKAVEKCDAFVHQLCAAALEQNLVAHGSLQHMWQRHLADSAQLVRFIPEGAADLLDLGTGAGFPGLILGLLRPDMHCTLVDCRSKRTEWLRTAVEGLALTNISIVHARVEQIPARTYDIVTARAFAPLPKLLELARRFCHSQTKLILPKGKSANDELGTLAKALREGFHVEHSLTDRAAGILVGRVSGASGT